MKTNRRENWKSQYKFYREPYEHKEGADRILVDWDATCKRLNIDHWFLQGTVLGMVREKGYIRGTVDIDVGVWQHDFLKLWDALLEDGFELDEKGPKRPTDDAFKNDPWSGHFKFYKYDIVLDVYTGFSVKRKSFFKPFDTITYKGISYSVPRPVEEYLEWQYGLTWRIPDRTYDD